MAFSAASSSSQTSEINVTPLIDVLLVLLIIFMVVLPVAPHGLESSLPQGKATEPVALPPVVVRLLTGDRGQSARYQVAGAELPAGALTARLQSMFALRQDRTVFIQADRRLSYQAVADVVSDARSAGAGAIVLGGLEK